MRALGIKSLSLRCCWACQVALGWVGATAVAEPSLREIQAATGVECTFAKQGIGSKVVATLARRTTDETVVFQGDVRLDRRRLFGRPIKFVLSVAKGGDVALGAGVLTETKKGQVYYAELFISMKASDGVATLEAISQGAAATLEGKCKLLP